MYGYIYKTTNKINGKIYIGQKHSSKFLGNKYLGSGKRLKDAIKHYGVDAFEVSLVEEVESEDLMDEREIYWIKYYQATDSSIGYNLSEGGRVNRTLVGENNPFYHKHHTEESRKKMSMHNARNMLGKHHSEETKAKIGLGNRGKVVSEKTREKLSLIARTAPNFGNRGKHLSEETKKKLSEIKKGKPSKAKGKIHITNDVEDKMVPADELDNYLALGWRRGRKKFSPEACENISKGHKGLPTTNGKVWINNGKINKVIPKQDLDKFLSDGWVKGML